MINKELKRRIIDITYKNKLSHLSSCLGAVDTLVDIYKEKLPQDKVVLSCGHAGLAQYVVLESLGEADAEELLKTCGIHPTRNEWLDCSTGSLGQGLPIAIGMALADRTRTVYCVISDGECAEGSIWESLNVIDDLQIGNIKVYALINGQSAYKQLDGRKLAEKLHMFYPQIHLEHTSISEYPHLKDMGILAHYRILDEIEYKDLMEYLK